MFKRYRYGVRFLAPGVVVALVSGCSPEIGPVGVSLSPEVPYHFSELEVQFTNYAVRMDDDKLDSPDDYVYNWFRNDISMGTGRTISPPDYDLDTYEDNYEEIEWTINGGEKWTVWVNAYDSKRDISGPISKVEVTVNRPPTASPRFLQNALPATGNAGWDLILDVGLSDQDQVEGSDSEPEAHAEVAWFKDPAGGSEGWEPLLVPDPYSISHVQLDKGDILKAEVRPYNRVERGPGKPDRVYGPKVEVAPLLFVNQVPALATVVAIQAYDGSDADGDDADTTVSRADQVECVFELEDDDDKTSALSAMVTWYTGSGNFVTNGLNIVDLNDYNTLAKGDVLECAVTPYDGEDYGVEVKVATPISLGNAVPVIAQDGVAIRATTSADGDEDSATATEGDTVECYVDPINLTDADNDTDLTLTYEWTINGVGAGTDQTLSSGFAIGDDLVCVATPDDIVDAYTGVPVSSEPLTVTGIPNILPEVADATILPEPASAGEPLECDYSYSDGDDEADASTYAWTINGVTSTEWPWVALSQNWNQSCVVDSNGNAECWGQDSEGVISQTPRDIPMKKISVGSANHGCGITMSDEVICWGLDDGSPYDYGQVTGVPAGGFKEIVAGFAYTCAISLGGEVTCWGDDRAGQVSDVPSGSDFVQLEADGDVILAVDSAGNFEFWGQDTAKYGDWEASYRTGTEPIEDISFSVLGVCLLADGGSMSCYGEDMANDDVLLYYPSLTKGFTDVAVSMFHGCAVRKNTGIKCWGIDGWPATPLFGEVMDAPTDTGYVAVDVGDSSSCALKASGEVVCWGISDGSITDFGQVSNAPSGLGETSAFLHSGGELGDTISCEVTAGDGRGVGNTVVSPEVTLDNSIPTVSDVAISPTDPGSQEPLVCEGSFSDAEGDPDQSIYEWTIDGAVAEGAEWRAVSAGRESSCAVDAVGQVVCWGLFSCPENAASCDGWTAEEAPSQLAFPGSMYQSVEVGLHRSICAIDADGDIHCIEQGAGTYTELMDNIPTASEYVSLSVGFEAACALSDAGELACWGVDSGVAAGFSGADYGQVTGAPTGTYIAVDLGHYLACAIDTSGALECWGDAYSDFGTSVSMPSGTYVDVSVADEHACALTTAGEIDCWGKDPNGQLQVSDTPIGTGFVKVATGYDRSCAIDADGEVHCWGRNVYETVGQSPSGSYFVDISIGHSHNCAIDSDNLVVCWGLDNLSKDSDYGQVRATPTAYNPIGETLTAEFTSSGNEISCTITPFDGTVYGTPDSSDSVTVLNSAPVVSAVAISPDPANASDRLTCSYTFDDGDSDLDQSAVVWVVEGVTLAENSDGDLKELTLDGGYFEGDVVECFVTANDDLVDGNTASASITINTSPVVSNVAISPGRPTAADTLTCSYSYSDGDGDVDQSYIAWTINGNAAGSTPDLTGGFSAGDEVKCAVEPSDGVIVLGDQIATVVINTPPVASNVAVTPSNATASDILSCGYTYMDADTDTEDGSVVEWFVDGTAAGTGTSLAGSFAVADEVTCGVTPSDGYEGGVSVTSSNSVLIENAAPVVSGIVIEATTDLDGDGVASTAGVNDELFCSYVYDDADGDVESGTLVEWLDNTALAYSTSGATLPGHEVKVRGDTITCVVTPNDGVDTGPSESQTITITNSLPVVSSVALTTSTDDDDDGDVMTMTSNDQLDCVANAMDDDNDILMGDVVWYVGGVELTLGDATSGGAGFSFVNGASGYFARGDQVECEMTVDDGYVVSDALQSNSVTIDNGRPTVSAVSVLATSDEDGDADPTTVDELDGVECSYVYSDPDGDAESGTTIDWLINGSSAGTGSQPGVLFEYLDGQTVACIVTPHDGVDGGTPVSGSVVIGAGPQGGGGLISDIVQIEAGRNHTCALDANGAVMCWGAPSGSAADLGQVTGVPNNAFVAITSGADHICGLEANGAVICWGDDFFAQCGGGSSIGDLYYQVDAGYSHTCGVTTDGEVKCWGENIAGQVSGAPSGFNYVWVTSGNGFSCALDDQKSISCWGDNTYGQESVPSATYESMSAGDHHICALTSAGLTKCWGDDTHAQTSNMVQGLSNITSGAYHTCGISTALDAPVCWGDNTSGQSTPPQGTDEVSLVGAGAAHTCALSGAGVLECWGDDTYGQSTPLSSGGYMGVSAGQNNTCAIGTNGDVACWGDTTWALNAPPMGNFVEVSVGKAHACGRLDSGGLDCWGIDDSSSSPDYMDQDDFPLTGHFSSVSAGKAHTCALDVGGAIRCWGNNSSDQVSNVPTVNGYLEVAAGGDFVCALDGTGAVDCWGADNSNQVGHTPSTTGNSGLTLGLEHGCVLDATNVPLCWGYDTDLQGTSPAPGQPYTQLSAAGNLTCGLKADGYVDCWGDTSAGVPGSVPQVAFQSVEVGETHACGVTVGGDIRCWGDDTSGKATPP